MSILDIVDEHRRVVHWDTLEGYEAFYPDAGEAYDPPVPIHDRPGFKRYTFLTPLEFRIEALTDHADNYRFVVCNPKYQQREWIDVMERMVYDRVNDLFVGVRKSYGGYGEGGQGEGEYGSGGSGAADDGSLYAVSIGIYRSNPIMLECSFFRQNRDGCLMIGHARV